MMKKAIMITIYLCIGIAAQAATRDVSHKPASLKNICTVQAGDIGTLKYKGSSYEDAFSKVTEACFQKRTDLYMNSRKQFPDQDRQIQFAESCVNSIRCI